jgi:hypothetical protein
MSQALNSRPSDLFKIKNAIHAFCFDRAVWKFGATLDSQLDAISEKAKKPASAKAKRQMLLTQWLAEPGAKGFYKDPAAAM